MIIFTQLRHLVPNARAWRLTIEKTLKSFFEGLSNGLEVDDPVEFVNDVYFDLFPQTTRELEQWERQFGLPDYGLTEEERRERLVTSWMQTGGQSPKYIQSILQSEGFDAFVHEWWEPVIGRSGGSIDGDVVPIARNPFDYLNDGSDVSDLMMDGADLAQDGDFDAMDGLTNTAPGYPLVNKILTALELSDGADDMQDGDELAQDGSILNAYAPKIYIMPTDTDSYSYYLYIGGENFPDLVSIPNNRRDEFETLCLKICPTEQWLGILAQFT